MPAPTFGGALVANPVAADVTGVAEGGTVQSFTDRVGGGTWTQSTSAKRPTWTANGLGGKPSFVFDGTDDGFLGGSWIAPALNGKIGVTIVAVVATTTTAKVTRNILHTSVAPSTSARFQLSRSNSTGTGMRVGIRRQDGDALVQGNVTDISPVADAAEVWTGAYDGGASSMSMWRNGTAATLAYTSSVPTGGFVATNALATALGMGANGTSEFWSGPIAELMMYDRPLTTSERAQVHSYAQDTYGVTVADYVAPSVPAFTGVVAQAAPAPAQAATGTRTAPAFSGAVAQVAPAPGQTVTAARAAPVFTGTAAQTAPAPSQAATAARTAPSFAGAVVQTAPAPVQAAQAAVVAPVFVAAAVQVAPAPTQTVAAAVTVPTTGAAVAQAAPAPTQAATAHYVLPARLAEVVQAAPAPAQAVAATRAVPVSTGLIEQVAPAPQQAIDLLHVAPVFTGGVTQGAPPPTQEAVGATAVPVFAGMLEQSAPAPSQQAEATHALPDLDVWPSLFTLVADAPLLRLEAAASTLALTGSSPVLTLEASS